MGEFKQLVDWSVCQTCGRSAARGTMHWLDLPYRKDPDYRVVRCPKHWTDHAIRQTALRRTDDGRRRMELALRYAEAHPELFMSNPLLDPFPQDDILEWKGLTKNDTSQLDSMCPKRAGRFFPGL